MKYFRLNKKTDLTKKIRLIVITSIILVFIVLAINSLILSYTRQQTYQYLDNMATLYVDKLDNTFFKIGRRLVIILMGDEGTQKDINNQFLKLEKSHDKIQQKVAIDQLREIFFDYTWEYGPEFQFFAYLEQGETYIRLNNLHLDTEVDDNDIRDNIIELIHQEQTNTYSIKKKWGVLTIGNKNYLVKLMKSKDRYIGCFVKADALLKSLESLSNNNRSIYLLADQKGNFVTGNNLSKEQRLDIQQLLDNNKNHWLSKYLILDKPFKRIPYYVKIGIANNGVFEKVIIVQLMLILLTIIILGTISFIMVYLKKSVLKPIQTFTHNLSTYDNDNYVFDITDSKIKELEAANEQFRNLLRQIKKMKITLYENELERQSIHMEYLQLQIKPHFYLNSLNFIYQMFDLGHDDKAQKMIRTTSNYLRYLFSNALDYVNLKDELQHVKNYLDIYKLRYQSAFSYHIDQDKRTGGCQIIPLIIQTFVENAIKHTVTLDKKIIITINVVLIEDGLGRYVDILVKDTGSGFPTEVLEKLQRGESLKQEQGSRVGIMNCLNRLDYFYGEEAQVKFSNSSSGGAAVDILIPFHEGDKTKTV